MKIELTGPDNAITSAKFSPACRMTCAQDLQAWGFTQRWLEPQTGGLSASTAMLDCVKIA
jgi:hypothetical protein